MSMSLQSRFYQVLILLLAISLAGCGFYLRGQSPLPSALTQITLSSNSGSVAFDRSLKIALRRAGVTVVEPLENNRETLIYQLKVDALSSQDTTLAVANDNDITQLEKRLTATYFIRQADGKSIYGPRRVSTNRTLTNQDAEASTKSAYNASVIEEMAETLAEQLVYDLAYAPLK